MLEKKENQRGEFTEIVLEQIFSKKDFYDNSALWDLETIFPVKDLLGKFFEVLDDDGKNKLNEIIGNLKIWIEYNLNKDEIHKDELSKMELFVLKYKILKILRTPMNLKEFNSSAFGAMELFKKHVGADEFEVRTFNSQKKVLYPYLNSSDSKLEPIDIVHREMETPTALNNFLIPIDLMGTFQNSKKKDSRPRFGREKDGRFAVLFPCYNGQDVFDSTITFYFKVEKEKIKIMEQEKRVIDICYKLKDFFVETVEGFRKKAEEIEKLKLVGITDQLTGVKNRRYFDDYLQRKIEEVKRGTIKNLSLLLIDIDFFKSVNDKYGHLVGDDVLKEITKAIQKRIRGEDVLARYGGEEFTVILNNASLEKAKQVAEGIRLIVDELIVKFDKYIINKTISVGVSTFSEKNDDIRKLTKAADDALYRAKENGRNRVEIDGELCDKNTKYVLKNTRKKAVQWLIRYLSHFA